MAGLAPGDVFAGDFRIVSLLAQGGMGAVYVVEQLSTNKRRALKLMLDARSTDLELRTRFEQEAKVGSLIASEHVVDVIAAGLDQATGMPWLAMELLEGVDLATHVERRGPLPPSEVAEIFAQLCHAVGAAHRIPVVHRDLKPQNVFLAQPRLADARFVVKVLDFGIAKVVSGGGANTTKAIGTPLWMAPEQTDTKGIVSPATDVWALGLIAFYLLTGKIFWKGGAGSGAPAPVVLREVVLDPIPSASVRLAELGGRVPLPEGFDAWFARACSRRPLDRFPTATEAWAALSRILNSRASAAFVIAAPVARRTHDEAPPSSTLEAPIVARHATLDAIGRTVPLGAQPSATARNLAVSIGVACATVIVVGAGFIGFRLLSRTAPAARATSEPPAMSAPSTLESAPSTSAVSASASASASSTNVVADAEDAGASGADDTAAPTGTIAGTSVSDLPSASTAATARTAAPPRSAPRAHGSRATPADRPPASAPTLISTAVSRPDHI